MKKLHMIRVAALLGFGAFALSGCSTITEQLQNERSSQFESTTDLEERWDKTAPWLPADATDIRTHESTKGDPAILSATTDAALDSSLCAETPRQSSPMFAQPWSPADKDVFVDAAFACGDWTVIAIPGGWYGWTPNDPDEKAVSPAQ
jgi:hypothetical protein